MGLEEVMLARMKQSHGLSRPHAGSFARREALLLERVGVADRARQRGQLLAPGEAARVGAAQAVALLHAREHDLLETHFVASRFVTLGPSRLLLPAVG